MGWLNLKLTLVEMVAAFLAWAGRNVQPQRVVDEWLRYEMRRRRELPAVGHHEQDAGPSKLELTGGLDEWYSRVEEVLPDDWAFEVLAIPTSILVRTHDLEAPEWENMRLVYRARAHLVSYDPVPDSAIVESPDYRQWPERALEDIYYRLRDML